MNITRKALLVLVAALAACALMTMCSCKPSDAIVEKIYDQNSKNIDYDNPDKIYIPDNKSKVTVEDLHMDKDNLPKKEQIKHDLPKKQGESNAQEIKDVEYDSTGASKKKAKKASVKKGKKATKKTQGKSTGKKNDKKEARLPSAPGGSSEGGGDKPGKNVDSETGSHGYDMDDDTYQNRTHDSRYGDTEDLPDDAMTIAATGELATITQVLGNDGTLVGSSEEYLDTKSFKEVFASKGLKEAKAVWAGDGSKTTGKDVDEIIDLAPDALVVFPGQLTSKQERVIAQNCPKMAIVTAPAPTSMDNISNAVAIVAKLLKKGTDENSLAVRDAYTDFVDDVLDEAAACHGGGVVTYNGVDYNNTDATSQKKADNVSAADPLWSLYISDWDDDAQVVTTYHGAKLFEDTGAAYTRTGWEWSPLSYLMSVGGVINNAAAYGPLSTEKLQPVLCINQNQVKYEWTDFDVDVDEARGGGSFTRYRGYHLLMNARDAADEGQASETHPLGSDDFNTVIVKNKEIKNELKDAREEEFGLYTMYGKESTSNTTGYGRVIEGEEGSSIVWTTVKGGEDDEKYRILVNPCGYVGSWTDGSLEAPLEALWIASEFYDYSESALADAVEQFYEQFYGYDISAKTEKILKGTYAEDE